MAERRNRKPQRRENAARYYSQTAEAYEQYEDFYAETIGAAVPERHGEPKRRAKQKKHRGIRYLHDFGQNTHSVLTYLSVALVFGGCLVLVLTAMSVNAKQRGINALKLELKAAQESTVALRAEVSESLDLAEVEQIAKTRLGMHLPETYQIRYITVPNETHLVQHEVEEKIIDEGASIASLRDLFGRED